MKIALVRRSCSLRQAGAERYCVNLFRQLQARGHEVTIVGESIDDDLRSEADFLPVRVNHTTSWTKNRSFAEGCKEVISQHRFDVVHGLSRAHGLDCYRLTDPLQAHWFNLRYRRPLHRFLQRLNPRHRTLFALERSIFQSPSVHRIITQSRLDSRLLGEYYGVPEEKIRRVYNGVDTSVFCPDVKRYRSEIRESLGVVDDRPMLVFASMDFRRKGLTSLLRVLAELKNRETCLLVLGKDNERPFRKLARQLGVEDRVLFAGRQQQIERYYGAGDLFVLPTIYEPFPNGNLEAMACGVPVLTTETAGGADLVEHGRRGYVVSGPDSISEMVAMIDLHLQLSETEHENMSRCCWEQARQMTLEENARQTLEVCEEVLQEKSRV